MFPVYRSARADYFRVMQANKRVVARVKRSIEEACKSCPFDHRNEPSVQLETTSHETLDEPAAKRIAGPDEFMTVAANDSTSTGRSLVGDLAAFAVKWKLRRKACNELFSVLKRHGIEGLPSDCRSAKNLFVRLATFALWMAVHIIISVFVVKSLETLVY